MVSETALDSLLPSAVQMASAALQSVVGDRPSVTAALLVGATWISQSALLPFTRRNFRAVPLLTSSAWSRRTL